jgi:hypothetical protein
VIGFSEVKLTEQTAADYADALAQLGVAIRLYRDTFPRLGLLGGHGQGSGEDRAQVRTATGRSRPASPVSGSRSPAAASRRGHLDPPRQCASGPITCGVCGQDFQPEATAPEQAASRA